MILLNLCQSLDDVDDVITRFVADWLGLPHFVFVKRFLIRSQIYNVVTFVLAKPNSSCKHLPGHVWNKLIFGVYIFAFVFDNVRDFALISLFCVLFLCAFNVFKTRCHKGFAFTEIFVSIFGLFMKFMEFACFVWFLCVHAMFPCSPSPLQVQKARSKDQVQEEKEVTRAKPIKI